MGFWRSKQAVDRGTYEVQTGRHEGKELPGVAGYTGDGKLREKNSMPDARFKFVRPDGRPD